MILLLLGFPFLYLMTSNLFLRTPSTQLYIFSQAVRLGHTHRRKQKNQQCSNSSEKNLFGSGGLWFIDLYLQFTVFLILL